MLLNRQHIFWIALLWDCICRVIRYVMLFSQEQSTFYRFCNIIFHVQKRASGKWLDFALLLAQKPFIAFSTKYHTLFTCKDCNLQPPHKDLLRRLIFSRLINKMSGLKDWFCRDCYSKQLLASSDIRNEHQFTGTLSNKTYEKQTW